MDGLQGEMLLNWLFSMETSKYIYIYMYMLMDQKLSFPPTIGGNAYPSASFFGVFFLYVLPITISVVWPSTVHLIAVDISICWVPGFMNRPSLRAPQFLKRLLFGKLT